MYIPEPISLGASEAQRTADRSSIVLDVQYCMKFEVLVMYLNVKYCLVFMFFHFVVIPWHQWSLKVTPY